MSVKIRNIHHRSTDPGRSYEGTGRTQQHQKDGTDINSFMRRYIEGGPLPPMAKGVQIYGDFTQFGDYGECLQTVADAQDSFLDLPSSIRDRMDNDPAQLLAFLNDPENLEEARELGLVRTPEPEPNPDPVPRAQPPESPEDALSPPQPPKASPISGGD